MKRSGPSRRRPPKTKEKLTKKPKRTTNDDGSQTTTWAQVVAQSSQTATPPQETSSSKRYDIEHGCDVGEYCKVLEQFHKYIGAASTDRKRSNRMQLYRRLCKRLKYANNNPGKKKREKLAEQFRANRDNDRKILRRFAKWADETTSARVGRRDAIDTAGRDINETIQEAKRKALDSERALDSKHNEWKTVDRGGKMGAKKLNAPPVETSNLFSTLESLLPVSDPSEEVDVEPTGPMFCREVCREICRESDTHEDGV